MTGQVVLSQAQANLKMSLWQVEAEVVNSSDLYVWLSECGLPHEVAIRLHDLTTYTEKVGNKVFAVGKIILLKIIEFVNAHPALVAGFGMGITVGIVVNHLVSSIPGIGYLLAPLATALATTLGIFIFGVAGHRVDKRTQGKEVQEGIIGIAEDVIEIVVVFFQLLADVFNIVFRNVITS
jgi:hypothetical protein